MEQLPDPLKENGADKKRGFFLIIKNNLHSVEELRQDLKVHPQNNVAPSTPAAKSSWQTLTAHKHSDIFTYFSIIIHFKSPLCRKFFILVFCCPSVYQKTSSKKTGRESWVVQEKARLWGDLIALFGP